MAQQYKLESDVNDFVKDCFKRLKLEKPKDYNEDFKIVSKFFFVVIFYMLNKVKRLFFVKLI